MMMITHVFLAVVNHTENWASCVKVDVLLHNIILYGDLEDGCKSSLHFYQVRYAQGRVNSLSPSV